MNIGIDIDGVCNNLVEKWISYLNNKYDLKVKYEDIVNYDISLFFPTLTYNQIFEPTNDVEILESLTPVLNSAKYLKQLINDGHDVKLITSTRIHNMYTKSKWILKYYPFLSESDIWVVSDKSWINADILLDDCIDNLNKGEYLGICYSQPWNKSYDGLVVNDWKEFYDLIKRIENKEGEI